MLPHIAHYWTREDMERLTGLLDGGRPRIEFVQGNSWHADHQRGSDPAVRTSDDA